VSILAIVNNLDLSVEQRIDVDVIICAIKHHIDDQSSESVKLYDLRSCSQQEGESFHDFLEALRELTNKCNFCFDQCVRKNIRDQSIEGLIDKDTIKHLLQ